jgi:hypothetical protein
MWYYNGVRIFVQGYQTSDEQIIARLNPINAGTVIQYFGSDDQILTLHALVVGSGDFESIRALKDTGTEYTLQSPYFANTNYSLKSLKGKVMQTICQTIRPDLPDTAPVFELDLELYRDE